jgi:uncharacterized membrane protein YvlD (DUF360 family)
MQSEDKFVYGPNWKLPMRFRTAGWVFLIIGSVMLAVAIATMSNPTVYVSNNRGLHTNDFWTKVVAAMATAILPIMGALLAFLPDEKLRFMVRPPSGGRRRGGD